MPEIQDKLETTDSRVREATPPGSSALELFQRAFDAGQIGVWSWDLRSRQLTWSTKLDDFHGRPEGTSDGTVTIAPMDVAPQDATGVLAAIAKSLQTREPCRLEYRLPGRSELGDFHYRLHIGDVPVVTGVFPLAAQRGRTTSVHVAGVNLGSPAGITAKVAVPAET